MLKQSELTVSYRKQRCKHTLDFSLSQIAFESLLTRIICDGLGKVQESILIVLIPKCFHTIFKRVAVICLFVVAPWYCVHHISSGMRF